MVVMPPWQSASTQQHFSLHSFALEHLCVVVSQMSEVHALLSLQSALLAQAKQPSFGSQIGVAVAQLPLSAVCEQTPPLQLSLVHATWSLQSVSAQHALQPSPQHFSPPQSP